MLAVAGLLAAAAVAFALPGPVLAGAPVQASFSGALTTTGPTPPPGVVPPSGARGTLAGAGEVLLSGVPAYIWRDGCAPTAAGMLVAFYDGRGFPGLIPGDAATQTDAADQAIASHGSSGGPRHYEDYALPKDDGHELLDDRSESPAGDEHADDCLADFMGTSRSALGLAYGWTYTSQVGQAVQDFVARVYPSATVDHTDYSASSSDRNSLFDRLRAEIDACRPVILYVDSSGDGVSDHAVVGVGYRETGGYPEYACLDTWYASVRWSRFRDDAAEQKFEVFGATTISVTSPDPATDTTDPVTTVEGADGGWSATPVTLEFDATDDLAGVDRIEAGVDGAALEPLDGVPCTLVIAAQGAHTVSYHAADKRGNVEATRTCSVRIDAEAPVTVVRAARVRQGARVSLRYRVDDVTPRARVRLVVRTLSGRSRATLRPGRRATGALLSASWRATLPRGVYRVWVYATDEAGNRQVAPGSARLTIR